MSPLTFGFSLPNDVREIAGYARSLESWGYAFAGLGEHLMMGNPPSPTPLSLPALGVAAGATSRIRLLSSVILLPMYLPVMLAKLVSTLDQASHGRYIFGIGIGGESEHEFRAAGIPVNERGRRSNEILDLTTRLWTEDNVTFSGRYYSADDVTLNPRPWQQPHPPIWVAGRRDAAMVRAARYGQGWLPYMYNPERYRRSVERIREVADSYGRDTTNFTWGYHQHVVIDDSRENAFRVARESFGYGGRRDSDGIIRDYWLCGTPEDVTAGIRALVDAGVNTISVISPLRDRDTIMQAAEQFSTVIMPQFPGLLSGASEKLAAK